MPQPRSAAVIDVGSNSIKLLVARRLDSGVLQSVEARTIDARIGEGLGRNPPRLSPTGIERAVSAVVDLLQLSAAFGDAQIVIVATSAVRDSVNGSEFCDAVRSRTGQRVRVLSGEEEANLIGRGIVTDPDLGSLQDFHLFDLGGGSLECLGFRRRNVARAVSLPLGCVRLTEKFVADTDAPFPADAGDAIARHLRATLKAGGWQFLPGGAPVVGTGGTLTTVRAIEAARNGVPIAEVDPVIPVALLRSTLSTLAAMTLELRRRVPGLPPRRADVFPTALATLVALAEHGRFDAFHHSFHNLRWGVADEALVLN